MIAGVDGCKAGWLVAMDLEDGTIRLEVFPKFGALLGTAARLIVVDAPIGIMSGEPRTVDGAARCLLRHRACCVFSSPYRSMLAARSHAEACEIREGIDGKRCTRQAFAIFAKIAEVDALMTPALQERVVEGHPEVTFAVMQQGRPMDAKKKSRSGYTARLDALESHFPEIDTVRAGCRLSGVARDDILDAYAMLWTARRKVRGTAVRLPTPGIGAEQCDDRGLRAEMFA